MTSGTTSALQFEVVWEHLHQLIGDNITVRTLDHGAPNKLEWSSSGILRTPESSGNTYLLGSSWLQRTWEAIAQGENCFIGQTIPIKQFSSAAMAQLAQLPYAAHTTAPLSIYLIRETAREVADVSKDLTSRDSDVLARLKHALERGVTEKIAAQRMRIGQIELRASLLKAYDGCCALCETRIPDLIRAAHIVRWAGTENARLTPSNAMLLCLTQDGLFELGLIALSDDLQVLVSPKLDLAGSASVMPMVTGLRFRQPRYNPPSSVFLYEHGRRHGFVD